MLPTLRVLYAEIAACCSSMASAMKFRRGLQHVRHSCVYLDFACCLPQVLIRSKRMQWVRQRSASLLPAAQGQAL